MDLTQLGACVDVTSASPSRSHTFPIVNRESEIPESLYQGMNDFLTSNPQWDQYRLMRSALVNFLFQNGCEDRVVTERYLNDLFGRVDV